jgi:hypothetical protein
LRRQHLSDAAQRLLWEEPSPSPRPKLLAPGALPHAAGDLHDGDRGGPWWTVEIRGRGVRILHHEGEAFPLFASGIANTCSLVRERFPSIEADAFVDLARKYRTP